MGKLYTRRGDQGSTDLLGSSKRVTKDAPRVAACGAVDELSSVLGWALAAPPPEEFRMLLVNVQEGLFELGAELATAPSQPPAAAPRVTAGHVKALEEAIDAACEKVAPLRQFILPGGSELAARLHVARAVCRRAERAVVTLAKSETIDHVGLAYLNRLGDLLFALARQANQLAGVQDVPWGAGR